MFVDDVHAPVLAPEDRHHLARVVRLRDGDPLTVGDGRGSWCPARFGTEVVLTGDVVRVPPQPDPITVGFALLKGSRVDDTVRHLTELGVDVIVPFVSERCVVRWDAATTAKRHVRLAKIAVEAAMQCRRAWLPTVEPLATFDAVVHVPGTVVAQMGAPALGAAARRVLVGPEGGFTDAEVVAASTTASLGVHVLRAETAALAAGALLADRRLVADGVIIR